MNARVAELSGGQRQALALSIALLGGARILLLDEFTAALDENARAAALQVVLREAGLTVLVVSHDESSIAEVVSGAITLDRGRLTSVEHKMIRRNAGDQRNEMGRT